MSRIDLGETGYSTLIFDNKLYFYKPSCLTNGGPYQFAQCDLYQINKQNEFVKVEEKYKGGIITVKNYFLQTTKKEDGSYGLKSCTDYDELCQAINDIDVSGLYLSAEKYTDTKESDIYIVESNFYVVKSKDNFMAIYNGQGNKLLDFGNYEMLGDIEYTEDGINANIEKIVLKDKSNGSYYFIGAENKVVTLTKEVADKIGIDDEKCISINHEIDKYYSFGEGYETLFFTLTDGLLNNKTPWDGHPSIKQYNNKYVFEEHMIYYGSLDMFNLSTLDGNPIIESKKYNHIYYFDNHAEIILVVDKYTDVIGIGKFENSNIDIHDGEKVVYSKELEIGDEITDVLIDEGDIWLITDDGEFKAVYVFRKKASEPVTKPEPTPQPTPEKDPEPEENNSCKKADGKYYDKSGKETTKEQHEKECLENPDTGYVIPFMGVLILIGGYVIIKNKKQLLKKI